MIKLQQRILLAAIVLVFCAFGAHKALAASPVNNYWYDGADWQPVATSTPMPISGTVTSSPTSPSTAGPTSITAAQCSTLSSLAAQSGIGVLVTGTWTGTLTASKSVDGTTFTTARMTAQPVGTTGSGSSVTANGTFTIDSAGMSSVKVCGNTVASGTAVVTLRTNTGAETTVDSVALLGGTQAAPSAVTISSVPAPSSASSAGLAPVPSTAAEASHVLKSGAGNLYDLVVTNGATAGYVLLFDATAAPSDGAVTPVKCYAMPATSSTLGIAFDAAPAYFATGITAVYSSTGCFTQTASATAFISGGVK